MSENVIEAQCIETTDPQNILTDEAKAAMKVANRHRRVKGAIWGGVGIMSTAAIVLFVNTVRNNPDED